MKKAFFELEGWEERIISQHFPLVTRTYASDPNEVFLTKDKIDDFTLPKQSDFEIISVFVNSRVTERVLSAFPNLKCIATRSTGFDHIDLEACTRRGIMVASVPGYGDNTVAEYAFGLILNLTRKMYLSIDQIKETSSFTTSGHRGVDIKGKTFGCIGTGRIGKEAIKIAKGFGMHIVAFDARPDEAFAREQGVEYMSLEKLLQSSDVISVHCPYNEGTHHLINKNNVSLIKRGAYLVNTARGPIIETDAIIKGLEEKIFAGVGLDVLEEEGETRDEMRFIAEGHPRENELKTIIQNHMLMRHPNVIITPHNAFNSQEALERILNTTLENIKGFEGGRPIHIVK